MSVSFLPCSDLTCSPLPCSPTTWSPLPCSPLPCSINSYFDSFREKEVVEEQSLSKKTLSERVVVKGTKTYPHGTYEGEFVDGLREGLGKFTFHNGTVFEGECVNDKANGKGVLKYNGNRYEGYFKDDSFHGEGVLKYSNGDRYEGYFKDNLRHGEGVYKYSSGDRYEGYFKDNLRHGEGKFTTNEGLVVEGTFCDDKYVGDSANLSDLSFLHLLIGSKDVGRSLAEYLLGIMSSFLLKNNYTELGNELASAYECFNPRSEIAAPNAEAIFQKLKIQNQPQLIVYGPTGHTRHTMGLKIIPDSLFVNFEIYNSGSGLPIFHKKHPSNNKKYQTKYVVRAPISSLSPELIQRLIDRNFKTADEVYDALKISGYEVVEEDPQSAIWQTEQKSDNCTLEWIFAYLRNNMSKSEYDGMRLKLFTECRERIKDRSGPEIEKIKAELDRKIQKRKLRLSSSEKSS